ncbi:D-xylose-proton symporter-like 3 [Durusdinium trenchii]|uniref:Chloroplastic n=1 Tax=Durusdinium trenchii TaxID=1381693 RepID=A0ABP0QYB9_9DINO
MWRTRNQDFYYEFPVASCKEFSQVSGLAGAELDSQRLTPVLFANCLVIGLSAALTGYDHGAASGALQNLVALKGLRRQRRFGPLLQGWVVASAWVSNIIGNLSGYYMPTPRIALIVAGLLEMLGSLLTGFAPTLWVLILGRLVNGFGLGLNGVAVAQYVSEVAPPHARGGAIAVQETTFVSGAFIGALVGQHFLRIRHGWRTIWGLAAFFGGLATVTMLRMPDTPRSIYRRAARMAAAETSQTPEAAQRHLLQVLEEARREAMSTMCQLRGIEFPDQAMLSELEGIERTYVSELNLLGRAASSEGAQEWWQEELPLLEILRSPVHLRLLLAGCAANALPALSGDSSSELPVVGCHWPTKVTACYGLSAVGLGLHSPGLAGAGLLASQAIYQSCVGPVTWIVSSELYPSDMRARGCALASATFSTSTLLSVQFHPLLISRGPFTVFATYAMTAQAAWLLTRVTAGSILGIQPEPDAAGQLALIQAPLSRLGDTARLPIVLVLMDFYLPEAPLPLKTAAASTAAAMWRLFLSPIDTLKTTYQVRGEDGLQVLLNRVKKNGPGELYAGAIATFAANWVGNYPYFVVFNALDQAWLAPSDPTMRIVRTGVMGRLEVATDDWTSCCNTSVAFLQEAEGYWESAQRVIQRQLAQIIVLYSLWVGSPLFAGLSIGTVLFVAIQALGGISGGNFNPAVSVSLGCVSAFGGPGMPWKQVGIYCLTQIVGGTVAALTASLMFGKSASLEVTSGYTMLSAGMCELFYTFMLCFVVLNVAAAKKNQEEKGQYFALAIGFCVVAGAYGAGVISGGAFNPAVAFSLDVTSLSHGFGRCFFYAIFEFLGAVLAAFLFSKVRPGDFGSEPSPAKLRESLMLSEFLGVFVLVLTVSTNILGGSSTAALSIACSLSAMIYALGDVSGGHFNPAVTCAVFRSGRDSTFTLTKALLYMAVQVLAGIVAALVAVGIFGAKMGTFGAKAPYHLHQALLGELVFTFTLSYVVLGVAVSAVTKASHFFGLAIGFCVVVGGFAMGNVSGGSLNPAVSLGLAVSGGGAGSAAAYVLVELLAGFLAATAFSVTHQVELESPEAKRITADA